MFQSLRRFFARTAPRDDMVGDWLLNDRFEDFLREPTPENYLRLRKLVLGDRTYRASASDLDDVAWLLDQGRDGDARRRLQGMGTARLLSPRAHQLAGRAARRLDDPDAERREYLIYHRCVEGILGTGDGTRERPYLVTHAGDEYDLIDHLERKIGGQELVLDQGRSLERIECQDGSALWFDLTDLHERLDDPPALSKPRRPARSR